jgi:hypothetical protein
MGLGPGMDRGSFLKTNFEREDILKSRMPRSERN